MPVVAILVLSIDSAIKESFRIAALRERRSIANMLEVMIRHRFEEPGISFASSRTGRWRTIMRKCSRRWWMQKS